jgi:hypothetical protein
MELACSLAVAEVVATDEQHPAPTGKVLVKSPNLVFRPRLIGMHHEHDMGLTEILRA